MITCNQSKHVDLPGYSSFLNDERTKVSAVSWATALIQNKKRHDEVLTTAAAVEDIISIIIPGQPFYSSVIEKFPGPRQKRRSRVVYDQLWPVLDAVRVRSWVGYSPVP